MANVRRVVLVPESLWRKLKALLAARGETLSGWVRRVAEKEIAKEKRDGRIYCDADAD